MTDLPTPQTAGAFPVSDTQHPVSPVTEGVGSKEKEGNVVAPEIPLDAVGKEVEMPKEVASAGVRVQPTTIPLPQKVQQMGVIPSGANVPPPTLPNVTLPLSDDQIAQGLRLSIASSWRWLAEWCIRQLKRLHMGLQYVHGRILRVRQ